MKGAKEKYLEQMRGAEGVSAHLNSYLRWLASQSDEGAEAAESLRADVMEIFTTEAGLRVLKLMEKSVLMAGVPNGSPDGALREMNAVRNFVLELRGIVANG